METRAKLCSQAIFRRKRENDEGFELKKSQSPYDSVFDPEKCGLRLKNDRSWQFSYLMLNT